MRGLDGGKGGGIDTWTVLGSYFSPGIVHVVGAEDRHAAPRAALERPAAAARE